MEYDLLFALSEVFVRICGEGVFTEVYSSSFVHKIDTLCGGVSRLATISYGFYHVFLINNCQFS